MKATDQSRRVVLTSGFVNQGLRDVITGYGWEFLYSIPATEGIATNEYAWKIDPEHSFHCFACTNYPIQYCLVVGPRHDDLLFQVSTQLDFMDVDDLIGAFDRAATIEEKEVTTYALGLCAGDTPESDIYERIQSMLGNDLPRLRLAAIRAAFITEWELFRTDLERLSRLDPDPIVKQVATNAVVNFVSTDFSKLETP